jgi:hypothetical protein
MSRAVDSQLVLESWQFLVFRVMAHGVRITQYYRILCNNTWVEII